MNVPIIWVFIIIYSIKEIRGRGIVIVNIKYTKSKKILGHANATLLVPLS